MDEWFNQNLNTNGWINSKESSSEYSLYIPSNITEDTKIVVLGCSNDDYHSDSSFVDYVKSHVQKDTIYMVVPSNNSTTSNSSNYANMIVDVAKEYSISTNNINVCSFGSGNIITSKIFEQICKSGNKIGTYINVMGDIDENTNGFQEIYDGTYYHINDHSNTGFRSETGSNDKNKYSDPKEFIEFDLEAKDGNEHNFYFADRQLGILPFLSGLSVLNLEENGEYFKIKGVNKHALVYEEKKEEPKKERKKSYSYTPTYTYNTNYSSNNTSYNTNYSASLSIKYDRDKTDEAVSYIKKAVNDLEKVKDTYNGSDASTLPPDSEVPSLLEKLKNDVNSNLDDAFNTEQTLQSMQDAAEKMTDEDYVQGITRQLQGSGFKLIDGYISKDGIPGLIYVPANKQSLEGLSLITYLPAGGRSRNQSDARSYGLGKIAESGYNLDAGIFLPIGDANSWDFNSNSRNALYNTIMEVATTNKVDMNRLSLVGASLGGETGFELVAEHPNTFASLTTFISSEIGGYVFKHANELAHSGTTFITYVNGATRDQYQVLDRAGAKVIGYDVGIGDDDNVNRLYSDGLLTDISNIQRGTNYLVDGNKLISVSRLQINDWSLLYEMTKNKGDLSGYGVDKETDPYYVSLTGK